MSKLKLLYISSSNENKVSQGNYYFQTELARICDLTAWHEPGDIHDILAKMTNKPDFILIYDHGGSSPEITGLTTVSIPYGIYVHDLHVNPKGIKNAIKKDKVNYIFSTYRDEFYNRFPEYKKRMRWLPHHANPEIFKDYGLVKEIDLLLMGHVTERMYPLRQKILDAMQEKPNFVYHKHPGYRRFEPHELKKLYVGEKYAREINRAKIFLTCNTIYNYPVRKYFEVLACNTLLLAPSSSELTDLGFIPGVHFVEVNENDFEQKANYYLQNNQERRKIAEQGYQMVQEYHITEIRAHQLVVMIMDILENLPKTNSKAVPHAVRKTKKSTTNKTQTKKKHSNRKPPAKGRKIDRQEKDLRKKVKNLQRKEEELRRRVNDLQRKQKVLQRKNEGTTP